MRVKPNLGLHKLRVKLYGQQVADMILRREIEQYYKQKYGIEDDECNN